MVGKILLVDPGWLVGLLVSVGYRRMLVECGVYEAHERNNVLLSKWVRVLMFRL